jgi:concentrative nucleoside transporter, CNT family
VEIKVEQVYANAVDAAASGASDGLKLAANVAAMLIAFLGLLAFFNALLGWFGGIRSISRGSREKK